MMRSLFAGVSGLKVHQTRMDVIGNNIANVNTPGFKRSRVTFQEMLNQTIRGASSPQGERGGTNPTQIGLGVALGSIDVIHAPGSPQSTGKTLDMAIEGEGYFVVGYGSNRYYTRAGNFDFDLQNNLVTSNGYYVQGWVADSETFQLVTGDPSQIRNINLGDLASKTINKATENISIGKNLDSRTVVQTGVTTYIPQISLVDITAIDPNDPETYITIQLPQSAVFDENFSISGITYQTLIANPDKWDFNPTTGQLVIKDPFPISEVQRIDLVGATSGGFTLSFGGQETTSITFDSNFDVLAANIQAALEALSNIGAGNVQVINNGDGSFDVVFPAGSFSDPDVPEMVIGSSTLDIIPAITEETKGLVTSLSQDPPINFKKADHTTPITIFDSQGNSHEANVIYYKSADNKWLANITIDGKLVQLKSTPSNPPNTEFIHEIEFNSNGEIISGTTINITYSNGEFGTAVEPLNIVFDFSNLTQVALDTSALGLSQDGFEPGSLESISVDTTGTIVGTYSNGQNIALAQVAIATFTNPGGLLKTGNTLFKDSKNSGEPQLGTPGTSGRGVIKPETLEMSNVDLSQEFVDMIITQRGFQANSRIITTSDEMLQELVNLKR
ncbi:MAG: flagellar hook protein FlgE [Clostridia bacterium]|nr:flagellar hook protein FlgE [Clostridia bacterium]